MGGDVMTKVSRDAAHFRLRIPEGLREEIREAAEANNRSMNAEIIARLSGTQANLRDQIAMHALGLGFDWTTVHETGGYAEAAKVAYEVADAMLAAREAKP